MNNQGTAAGISFLNQFLKIGSIVGISGNKFKTDNGKYEFDPLMMVYLQDGSGIKTALADVYPPYKIILDRKSVTGGSTHEHTFGLLNLISNKLLLIGLGRKCYPFVNDAETGEEISWPSSDDLSARSVFNEVGITAAELDEFFVGDDRKIAKEFFDHIVRIGDMIRSREYLGLTPFEIEETAHKKGKDKNQALEDLGMDEEEFSEILSNYSVIESAIKNSISFINQYFPRVDESDINSDDFF